MSKIMLIAGVMLCCHLVLAADEEFKDAKLVDLSQPSPEATVVKAIQALDNKDEEAYSYLLNDAYKKTKEMHFKVGCNMIARTDVEKGIQYKVVETDDDGIFYVQYRIPRKGQEICITAKFKIISINGEYLICGR